eukprot:Blabericola_migrator_1__6320@NODE_318_length_9886_cov_105_778796_g259_i0_p7_GENE_NODE_318_length_9886_cov_105_778796_g259_i0NODE_318_length_9886_cov_105_778796_g259_i0_p7_ORF_typecomplete_len140_score5_63Ntox10/PF15520_6/0_087_NODE_318_length_9886_cov_105_778796_g259_i017702189
MDHCFCCRGHRSPCKWSPWDSFNASFKDRDNPAVNLDISNFFMSTMGPYKGSQRLIRGSSLHPVKLKWAQSHQLLCHSRRKTPARPSTRVPFVPGGGSTCTSGQAGVMKSILSFLLISGLPPEQARKIQFPALIILWLL